MTHNHSGIPFHNFIVGGKSIEGALPLRPSKDKAMSRLSSTRLARWVLQINTILRKAFFRQEQGTYTRLWQAWSAQSSDREESPVLEGNWALGPHGRAATLPLSQTNPARQPVTSSIGILPPPKRGGCEFNQVPKLTSHIKI